MVLDLCCTIRETLVNNFNINNRGNNMTKAISVVGTETKALSDLMDEKSLSNYEIDYLIKFMTAKRPINITNAVMKKCPKGYKNLAGRIARVVANEMRKNGYPILKGVGNSNEAYPRDLAIFFDGSNGDDGRFYTLLKDKVFQDYPTKGDK